MSKAPSSQKRKCVATESTPSQTLHLADWSTHLGITPSRSKRQRLSLESDGHTDKEASSSPASSTSKLMKRRYSWSQAPSPYSHHYQTKLPQTSLLATAQLNQRFQSSNSIFHGINEARKQTFRKNKSVSGLTEDQLAQVAVNKGEAIAYSNRICFVPNELSTFVTVVQHVPTPRAFSSIRSSTDVTADGTARPHVSYRSKGLRQRILFLMAVLFGVLVMIIPLLTVFLLVPVPVQLLSRAVNTVNKNNTLSKVKLALRDASISTTGSVHLDIALPIQNTLSTLSRSQWKGREWAREGADPDPSFPQFEGSDTRYNHSSYKKKSYERGSDIEGNTDHHSGDKKAISSHSDLLPAVRPYFLPVLAALQPDIPGISDIIEDSLTDAATGTDGDSHIIIDLATSPTLSSEFPSADFIDVDTDMLLTSQLGIHPPGRHVSLGRVTALPPFVEEDGGFSDSEGAITDDDVGSVDLMFFNHDYDLTGATTESYGVDYAVWPRGGKVAPTGEFPVSGQRTVLTSPPYVRSQGPPKRLQRLRHQLHLDREQDANVLISHSKGTLQSQQGGGSHSSCFSFEGSSGNATVVTFSPVRVRAVQIVYYRPLPSPLHPLDEDIQGSSAPHQLRFTGWLSDPTHDKGAVSVDLGTYLYVLPTSEEEEVQTFPLRDVKGGKGVHGVRDPLRAVTVSVLSNHGERHTTMCRVRVLGELAA